MKLTYNTLFEASTAILAKLGARDTEARQVADSLVRANMRGLHTHGVKYLRAVAQIEFYLLTPAHLVRLISGFFSSRFLQTHK